MAQFYEYAGPKLYNTEKAFCWFLFRLSQALTFAQSQSLIIISNWCQPTSTHRFSVYHRDPYFSLSPSPFSPAFSKKPSQPLAWMLRTSLRIVSAGVAQHMHISQGCLITSSSCTGTGAGTLINFICLCIWQCALVSQMLWLPRSLIQCSQVTIFFIVSNSNLAFLLSFKLLFLILFVPFLTWYYLGDFNIVQLNEFLWPECVSPRNNIVMVRE